MTISAQDFLGRRFVCQAFYILVAIHARQLHRAVDGMLELCCIHEERDLFAADVGCERRITVAGEAVFIFQLVLGASGESRAQQKKCERTEQDSAGNFHDFEKTLLNL
jgi:hypothetical protein